MGYGMPRDTCNDARKEVRRLLAGHYRAREKAKFEALQTEVERLQQLVTNRLVQEGRSSATIPALQEIKCVLEKVAQKVNLEQGEFRPSGQNISEEKFREERRTYNAKGSVTRKKAKFDFLEKWVKFLEDYENSATQADPVRLLDEAINCIKEEKQQLLESKKAFDTEVRLFELSLRVDYLEKELNILCYRYGFRRVQNLAVTYSGANIDFDTSAHVISAPSAQDLRDRIRALEKEKQELSLQITLRNLTTSNLTFFQLPIPQQNNLPMNVRDPSLCNPFI